MSEQHDERHLGSSRVEAVKGGVAAPTPCHEARVVLPTGEAVPDVVLRVVCPEGGEAWLLTLEADESADTGLRAVWMAADEGEAGR